MSSRLFARNADLLKLRQEGYNVDVQGANLIVRDIPHVDESGNVHRDGILVTALNLNGEIVNQPDDHTIRFAGKRPHTSDRRPIEALRLDAAELRISEQLTTNFHFSSKPEAGQYPDYYQKIRTYVGILSGPATTLDPEATARTFRVIEPTEDDSPFHYLDSASARAEIDMVTNKLVVEKVAIVGLGGTGSYVLDLLAKTPVRQIHLFDGDKLSSHNAFRAPGAASIDQLHEQPWKVDYFAAIYSKMHRGIIPHPEYLDETNLDLLRGMACVFVCMDTGPKKKIIIEGLERFEVPYIDTGMGLYVTNETLGGVLRTTTGAPGGFNAAKARMSFAEDKADNLYDKNIQVADLNALNATMAVIRWKKMRGFYFDFKRERFSSYTIGTNRVLSEDLHED